MAQEKVKVLWNKEITRSYMHIGLEGEKACATALAGQFVMLKAGDRIDPLLRRPFSIHQVIKKDGIITGIEILYKVVGTVTNRLSRMKQGEIVDLVGPLGNGFEVSTDNKKVFITAGGIGLAPFVYLATQLIEEKTNPDSCHVFIGGKTKEDILCKDFFDQLGMQVHVATDDGSLGYKGLITDLISSEIEKGKPDIMYSCGPHPMLKAVAGIAAENEIKCQVSTETLMACGMGACLGCAVGNVQNEDEYLHVCVDGPVFDSEVIKL